MATEKRERLAIDRTDFELAFGRDADEYLTYETIPYLDRRTGAVVWVYENDEEAWDEANIPAAENRAQREAIAAAPKRYLEIPGLDHGDHHDMLRAFVRSDWTDDEDLWRRVYEAYTGSIGRWKRAVPDRTIVHAFHAFEERRTAEMAEDFLRANGIEPAWR
jgi:hypothetical protein